MIFLFLEDIERRMTIRVITDMIQEMIISLIENFFISNKRKF